MNTTLRQLKIFEAVARQLSFTKAAQELHLTQPAVSMQVSQLEESAGLPLFEKVGKHIKLTEAGTEMFYYSQNIQQQLRELSDVMESLKGGHRGHLRISAATTANSFATQLISSFTHRYPEATFALDVTNRQTLLVQLEKNEADLVIMGQPPEDPDLQPTAFMENPLVIIAAPNHPLARANRLIGLHELEQETFVVREKQSGTRIAMERFFNERHIEIRAGMEMTSNSTIKHSVAAGLGLGLVSYHTLELELETGRLVILKVEDFPIHRHWHVVFNRRFRLPPIAREFLDFLHGQEAEPLLRFRFPDQ
ncbi:unnamed protein product [Cyprideis torosa]|uniref:Uncharacterized protein n=1 Tax=Cyprideis torosa TaxID=163714 RepID=A0A7R8WS49_9CRUS|nr:unnamed protein product [Cyprideis torosa]CAG0909181.1 unnamed protein product [Cyprideis torosa]